VPARIVARGPRVYFAKVCPTHGPIEDFVCSDLAWFDRMERSKPARPPRQYFTEPRAGCPLDCGLCPEHAQHTCVGLAEITSSCNLTCPTCYAGSAPGGTHWSFETFRDVVARFVLQEGEPDVLQISGGEPTIHPQFVRFVRHAVAQPIQVVMVNTNGIRLARDPALLEALAPMRERLEIYLQFDGFDESVQTRLRGEPLLQTKLRALEALAAHGIRATLVCTVQSGVNLDQVGAIVRFGLERPWIRGVSFQPAAYAGRHPAPGDLQRRATIPDVIRAIEAQTAGLVREDDFMPLPCAHPNCHAVCYVFRGAGIPRPVSRLIDVRGNADLLPDTLVYTPPQARQVVSRILERSGCCGPEG
jgi:uncharacterized radical SAM superfamily Fe-S cluster-containing enzyme